MKINVFLAAIVVGLTICVPAFSQEITNPKGLAFGVSVGQRAGDLSIGLDVTSPYFKFYKQRALLAKHDQEGQPLPPVSAFSRNLRRKNPAHCGLRAGIGYDVCGQRF